MTVETISKIIDTATERLVEDATTDPALRYALATRSVDGGVAIGDWMIRNDDDGFSVSSPNEIAAFGICLYDVALHVAHHLLDGGHARRADIRQLLDVDRDYGLAVADANWLRERIRSASVERAAILEDRHDHALQRVFDARETIRRLMNK